jgi:hypothetical protein
MSLTKRLSQLERNVVPPKPISATDEEIAAKYGMTLQDAIKTYGSIPTMVYRRLIADSESCAIAEPDDGLTAQERYFRMIGH